MKYQPKSNFIKSSIVVIIISMNDSDGFETNKSIKFKTYVTKQKMQIFSITAVEINAKTTEAIDITRDIRKI